MRPPPQVLVPCLLAGLLAGGCGPRPSADAAADTVTVTDARGRSVSVPTPPARVVSLVPSVTELIVALGAADALVARTRHDTAREVRGLPSLGEPLTPSRERLMALDPDLVLAWDLPGSAVETMERGGRAVHYVRASTLADVEATLGDLGRILGVPQAADSLLRSLRCHLERVSAAVAGRPRPDVAFVLWPRPLTVAGPGSYLDSLMAVAGGRNAFDDGGAPWIETELEALVARDPAVLLLGRDADDFRPEALLGRPGWEALGAVRTGRAHAVPAALFHRPGVDLGRAVRTLAVLLHPGLDSVRAGC